MGLAVLASPAAYPCPVCRSENGERVRQALVGPDLARNVAATLLPFLILFVIVGWFHFRPGGDADPSEDSR